MSEHIIPTNCYIIGPDGDTAEINAIADISINVDETQESFENLKLNVNAASISFEAFGKIYKDAFLLLTGITQMVLEKCPNRRVVHLSKFSKKKRTRKKNLHRAFKILEV